MLLRFCIFSFLRISLDFLLVFESALDSVELDSESNSKTLNLDSESVLDSKFLRILCFMREGERGLQCAGRAVAALSARR